MREVAAIPEKTVVLTFDDAVQSHRDFVAPLLAERKFGATFFVTHAWMVDVANFMNWEDIAQLHEMGFEIGNHTWSHSGLNEPRAAEIIDAELEQVVETLAVVGVPQPVSFGWPGNGFGPEAAEGLVRHGIRLARRGMQPEKPYGQIHLGPLYEPAKHHPLYIPTSGDAYPDWTMEHFERLVNQAGDGKIVVLQFHGVPDVAHPWVHTPPEMFRQYMDYLAENEFNVIALRDVEAFIPEGAGADDPIPGTRWP